MNNEIRKSNESAAGVITTAALVSIFVYSLVVSLAGTIINEIVEAFSLEGTDEGLMSSLTSLGFMLSLFFVILVQGRVQKTTMLMAALILQAAGLLVCGISPVFILFCTGCLLIGFSGGFIDTCCNSAIVDVQKSESPKYLGFLHGLFGVGSLLSPLLFIWMLRYTDWRGIHLVLAGVSVLVVIIVFLMVNGKNEKISSAGIREHLFTKADLLAYLRVKRNVALAFAGFFSTLTITCVLVWIVRYMTLQFDSAELGAISFSVYWVCATLNRFLSAYFVKRAPVKFFILGTILSGVFLFIGVISSSPILLCVMVGAFGFCSGHFIPVLVSECAIGYEGRTTFTTSFVMIVLGVARIAAPLVMAFVGTQISLTIGMMLPVASALIASCCGWFVLKAQSQPG